VVGPDYYNHVTTIQAWVGLLFEKQNAGCERREGGGGRVASQ
jgi:hypothetical protein